MSPFSRRAIAVSIVASCALLLPGAYTAVDEDDSAATSSTPAVASPSPEPSSSPSPQPSPTEAPEDPDPSATPSVAPSPTPSARPSPTPSPDQSPGIARGDQPDEALHLSLGVAPATIEIGEETIVGVTITNPNDDPAEDVMADVTLPRELGFVSSDPGATSISTAPHATKVSFDNLQVPGHGWLTIAIVAEGLEETKRPATVAAHAAWGDSDASDRATVNVVAPEGNLRLMTSGPRLLATIGETVVYQITLRNPGDTPLEDVAIVNLVPDEVHVTSAGLAPGIDAVQVGHTGNSEDVVWTIDEMDAGEVVKVSYRGVVDKLGDLEALNRTTAHAGDSEREQEIERTYLAASGGADQRNPSFDPVVERHVVTERVVERPLIRRRAPTEPGGVPPSSPLPYSGFDPWGTTAAAIMLIGLGAVFIRLSSRRIDRRRVVALTLLVLLLGGACISSEPDTPDGDARVKGKQIERGERRGDPEGRDEGTTDDANANDEGPGEGARGGGSDGDDSDRDGSDTDGSDDDTSDDTSGTGSGRSSNDDDDDADSSVVVEPREDDEEDVFVPGPPVVSFERRVEIETLTEDDLAVERVLSIGDATPASFTWDDSGSVGGGGSASSRHAGLVKITTSVLSAGRGMRAIVTIENTSERTRADVSGRLDLVISGSGGGSLATLTGATVDALLNPGGEVSADFVFRLPAGSYAARGVFLAR